jgi:hypothetical protein
MFMAALPQWRHLMDDSSGTRREFVRKAAYVAPAILTLAAAPSFAKSGSEKPDKNGHDDEQKKPPKPPKVHGPKLPVS